MSALALIIDTGVPREYGTGRRCLHPGCSAPLTRFNPNPWCGMHVEAHIDDDIARLNFGDDKRVCQHRKSVAGRKREARLRARLASLGIEVR